MYFLGFTLVRRLIGTAEYLGRDGFQVVGGDGTAAVKAVGRGAGGEDQEDESGQQGNDAAHGGLLVVDGIIVAWNKDKIKKEKKKR
jgi:hypothetical protein